jgi:hypothetical protein
MMHTDGLSSSRASGATSTVSGSTTTTSPPLASCSSASWAK